MIWPRIIAAKLPPPASIAPADMRALQLAIEILGVQLLKQFSEIKVAPLRPGRARPNAPPAHVIDAFACAMGAGIVQIRRGQGCGGPAPVHTRQQQCSRAFQDREWPPPQEVRESNIHSILAAADR